MYQSLGGSLFWICLNLLFLDVESVDLFDGDVHEVFERSRNPYLLNLEPIICSFQPIAPLASECCVAPPIFPRADFKKCFTLPELQNDGDPTNCTKFNCVLSLYKIADEDGFLNFRRFSMYFDNWSQLYPDYNLTAKLIKKTCFFGHIINIYLPPCLMFRLYHCYLDQIYTDCPVYRSDGRCKHMPYYKQVCKLNRLYKK